MTMELHATPEEVMRAVGELQEFGRQRGISEKELFGPLLALEECGSNIIDYALGRDSRQKFRVTIEYSDDILTIELRDPGPEFDPTTFRKPESSHDDPAGGWGLQLVRRSMDAIRYRRETTENVLNLTKIVRDKHDSIKNEQNQDKGKENIWPLKY
jgi:anti-sigma regulatory factor (Ser/Thr protein kinase)